MLDDLTNTELEFGLFLLSDEPVQNGVRFDYIEHRDPVSSAWSGSLAQEWCEGFLNTNLSGTERGAIFQTTKSDAEYKAFAASNNILNGDKVFFLSAEEVENADYGFSSDDARIGRFNGAAVYWWLRSRELNPEHPQFAGYVSREGTAYPCTASMEWAARPAFNLDKTKVLMTSNVAGGKSLAAMEGGLTEVSVTASGQAEWKLTLRDGSRAGFAASPTELTATSAVVAYSGAKTGENEYISAIIVNDSDDVLYYGRVMRLDGVMNGASGTVSISIPENITLGDDATLKVFSEQYNGERAVDYACEPVTIAAGEYGVVFNEKFAGDLSAAAVTKFKAALIAFAAYDGSGRLISVGVTKADEAAVLKTYSPPSGFSAAGAAAVKAMLLDADGYAALCAEAILNP